MRGGRQASFKWSDHDISVMYSSFHRLRYSSPSYPAPLWCNVRIVTPNKVQTKRATRGQHVKRVLPFRPRVVETLLGHTLDCGA